MADVDVRRHLDQAKDIAYSAADTTKARASEYATAAQDTVTAYASKAADTAKEALQPLLGTPAGYASKTDEEVSRLLADLPKQISQPYRPRDNIVPSKERPEGHYATPPGRTPLQQHLDYFDMDKNGVIYPWETFMALRFLKFAWEPFNSIIAFWLTALFHVAFSYQTQDSWLPSPVWSIITKNASMTKHGASSGSYDHNGYFIPGKFEEIFARFDSGGRGRLSVLDVATLVWSKAQWNNPFGTFFTALQWAVTLWVFHDDNWQLRKNDVRGLYDGTAFYRLADRNGNPWYGMSKRRDAVAEKKMG